LIFATIPFWHTFFEVAIATQQNNYTLTLPSNLHHHMPYYSFFSMFCNYVLQLACALHYLTPNFGKT
jgi:hypothetical protein